MKDPILDQVKQIILQIEPGADIILYGSRARGDATSESDWDFLILLDGPVNAERTDRIRHALYELEWDIGTVISSVVRNRMEWQTPIYQASNFRQAVQKDGISL
jgi:uncharacterized protein